MSYHIVSYNTISYNSPSNRGGTLKGIPTDKSPKHHFQATFKSLKGDLFLEPHFSVPILWDGDTCLKLPV